MRIRYGEQAREDIKAAARLWKTYRHPASSYFATDLSRMRALLVEVPYLGVATLSPKGRLVRRLVLRRSGYLFFYEVNEEAGFIEVLGLWDPRRGPVEGLF